MKPIVVYGAGGLAREVAWLIERINRAERRWDFRGYVVTDTERVGEYDSKQEIVGAEDWLRENSDVSVAMGVGTPKHRLAIAERLADLPEDRFPALIDPTAVYDAASCTFEPGCVVTANCVLTVNVRLERFAFVNLSVTIGHEAQIGKCSVLNPTVNISGGVKIGAGCLVGTGAQVLQYLQVGAHATIGSGAVVTKDVAPGCVVVGVPAKPLERRT